MTLGSMAAGRRCYFLSAILCLGCVNLDKPQAVGECSSGGGCTSLSAGGVSGSKQDAGSSGGVGGSGGAGVGGRSGNGGVSGSGGSAGEGGTTASGGTSGGPTGGATADGGSGGSGATTAAGGSASGDAAINVDVPSGSGGTSIDAASSTGGSAGSGGTSTSAASSSGGATGAGGSTSVDGAIADATASGGKTTLDAATSTGGTGGAGGSTTSTCGAVASKVSQVFNFATGLGSLSLGPSSTSGTHLTYATAGPAADPALCSPTSGCAALSLTATSGAAAYAAFALAVEGFTPTIDLVGSTVTFSLAVDNPGTTQVPIQIQAYAQGDVSASYAWTLPATVGGASLQSYAVATGFKDLTLSVVDSKSITGNYCAAITGAIGIQLQNTAAITASNAGTVTVYIAKITITPPA